MPKIKGIEDIGVLSTGNKDNKIGLKWAKLPFIAIFLLFV